MSTTPLRIFGLELSPYSVKVRSYLRYKRIPHAWITRNAETQAEYQKYAKLPLVPLVVVALVLVALTRHSRAASAIPN